MKEYGLYVPLPLSFNILYRERYMYGSRDFVFDSRYGFSLALAPPCIYRICAIFGLRCLYFTSHFQFTLAVWSGKKVGHNRTCYTIAFELTGTIVKFLFIFIILTQIVWVEPLLSCVRVVQERN